VSKVVLNRGLKRHKTTANLPWDYLAYLADEIELYGELKRRGGAGFGRAHISVRPTL
jgi:hypothetical protein